jgi:hypothetical protein
MTDNALHTSAPARKKIYLDLPEAAALLNRAVAEKGKDYVATYPMVDNYPVCMYFDPETKKRSCIVGHVLSYKGLTIDDLEAAGRNSYANIRTLIDEGFLSVDSETEALLAVAQCEQDTGQTWGRALEEALETYDDLAERYKTEGYQDDANWDHYLLG